MNSALLVEDISRIKFLMGYDSSKVYTEQKIFIDNPSIILEGPKDKWGRPQGDKWFGFNNTTKKFEEGPYKGKTAQQAFQKNQLTPQQEKVAKEKIAAAATKEAEQIFGDLKKAMDMDGDNVLNDYDGTNETNVVNAIKKIKSKDVLDRLNQRVAKTGQYRNLKAWINDELSDFDSEYGEIWDKLESLGYSGANRNIILKVAGYTPAGLLIKGADKAIDTLRGMSFEDIMEGFRDVVGGAAGTVAQIIIGAIPGFGQAAVALINGVLFGWDVYQYFSGSKKWSVFNTIADFLSTLLSFIPGGKATTAELNATKPALKGANTFEKFFIKLAEKFPKLAKIFSTISSKIATWGGYAVNAIEKGIVWVMEKLPFLKPALEGLRKILGRVGEFLTKFAEAAAGKGAQIGGKIISKIPASIKTAVYMGTQWAKQLGKTLGRKFYKLMLTKLGSEVMKEVDKQIVKKIEDWIWTYGENLAIKDIRPKICKFGPSYCSTFDIIINTILVGKEIEDVASSGKKAKESRQKIKTVKGSLEKVRQAAEYGQNLSKTIEKGIKTGEKGYKAYQDIVKEENINNLHKKSSRGFISEEVSREILEIKRYILLLK